MTEAEWLACNDPRPMMRLVWRAASDRRWRLFGCASCRRIWDLLPEGAGREAVAVAERYADGAAGEDELRAAYRAAWSDYQRLDADLQAALAAGGPDPDRSRAWAAEAAAEVVMRRDSGTFRVRLFPAGVTAARAAGYSARPAWDRDDRGAYDRPAGFAERLGRRRRFGTCSARGRPGRRRLPTPPGSPRPS
jgi:hypothetical protein